MAASRIGRYSVVAMLLHWVIAALILWQIAVGNWMGDALHAADEATQFAAYQQVQLHKSIGLTILGLSVLRLVWRWLNPQPPLPSGMSFLERAAARLTHVAFYLLMLGVPLVGWAMVSSNAALSNLPTGFFGLFTVPHLPLAEAMPAAELRETNEFLEEAHETLAYGAALLLILHVAAALKHHFVDRDQVLARMVPGLSPRGPVEETRPEEVPGFSRLAAVVLLAGSAAGVAGLYLTAETKPVAAAGESHAAMDMGDAPVWLVTREESEIAAVGANSGSPFRVVFSDWSAEIAFDPERLEKSKARVIIQTASGATGDMQYDGALTGEDWLNAGEHPEIIFEAENFRPAAEEGVDFVVDGRLTLRGVTKPLSFPFALTIDGGHAEMETKLTIDRTEFGVGNSADASGMVQVSRNLDIELRVVATRAPES